MHSHQEAYYPIAYAQDVYDRAASDDELILASYRVPACLAKTPLQSAEKLTVNMKKVLTSQKTNSPVPPSPVAKS